MSDVIELRQSDYDSGTYIMKSNSRYRLMENIVFHPNPNNDFMPTAQQLADGTYNAQATQIGFTTANQLSGHDIDIDLNGHSFEQSPEHALQQRFHSHFQFGKTPFIDKAGPLDFVEGDVFIGPQRVTIRNGTLGLSSHHGIQGNDCKIVILEDLVIRDFEVAAISANLVNDITFRRTVLGPTRRDVPVVATYSQSRFIRIFIRKILANPLATPAIVSEGASLMNALETRMNQVRADVLSTGHTNDLLFTNPSGLPDGTATYGAVLHGKGPSVNDFSPMPAADDVNTKFSERVRLHSVTIQGIVGAPHQVVGISTTSETPNPSGSYAPGVQHDCIGALLDIKVLRDPVTDEYRPNELANLQAFMGAYRELLPAVDRVRVTISPGMVNWMRVPGTKLTDIMNQENLYFLYNGDSMFHVMKGNMGLRMDLVQQAVLQDVTIRNCQNQGAQEGTLDGSEYEISHPKQTQTGYQGAVSRGIVMSACRKVRCRGVTIDGVRSDYGMACGIDMLNDCDVSFADSPHIGNVEAPMGEAFEMRGFVVAAATGYEPCDDDDDSATTTHCSSDDGHHDGHHDDHEHCHGHDDHDHDHCHDDHDDHGHDSHPDNCDSDFEPPHSSPLSDQQHCHDGAHSSSGNGGRHSRYSRNDHKHKRDELNYSTWISVVLVVIVLLLVLWWWWKRRSSSRHRQHHHQRQNSSSFSMHHNY